MLREPNSLANVLVKPVEDPVVDAITKALENAAKGLNITVADINLLLIDEINDWMEVTVKIRYSAKEAKAKIIQDGPNIRVIFDEPQKAITPGQSAVFYVNDIVLGGGKM